MPHCNKKMLSFFLTTKCNLCCRYCYNAKERSKMIENTLNVDIAKAGIDWYFEHSDCRHIRFYGPGEPTQEFGKMVEITQYAKNHPNGGNRVTVEIQTNGIFNEYIREWVLNNVNIIWLSFDGMKDIQNYNRPLNPRYCKEFQFKTSADILENNARWLIDNTGDRDLMVGARVTITELNINQQVEMVDYFNSLGIKNIWNDPLFSPVGTSPISMIENFKAPHINLDEYIDNYILAYKYAKAIGVFWGSFLAVNFDGKAEYHCRSCTPLAAPHITTDGYLSACDMVLDGKDSTHMDCFIFGRWNSNTTSFELDYEKIHALNKRKSTNMEHCENCIAKYNCGGYCLGETVNETGSLLGQNKKICNAICRLYTLIGEDFKYTYLHP